MGNNAKGNIIKLLVCYHKPAELLKDDVLTPIHVGRAVSRSRNDGNLATLTRDMIGDDTGDNISEKNGSYNELTAIYWAWKNYDKLGNPDYIGLMHYRRHFIFKGGSKGVFELDKIDENYFETINYSEKSIQELMAGCDFAYHLGKVKNIYRHYADNHRIEDLDIALDVIKEKYPSYYGVAKKYVGGSYGCFCNMFIFSRVLFFEYCEWIFSILNEFEKRVNLAEKRLFVSERLTGIFISKKLKEGKIGKTLAATFVKSPVEIPVAMPFDEKDAFLTAVTVTSFVANAENNTSFAFKFLTDGKLCENVEIVLKNLQERYKNFVYEFIDIREKCGDKAIEKAYYPLLLGKLLNNVGKCLYVTPKVLILRDIELFFRICSVDDFYLCGIPDGNGLCGGNYMLNLSRMRKHEIFEKAIAEMQKNSSADEAMSTLCKNEIGRYPSYFYAVENENTLYPKKGNTRKQLQNDNKVVMCYFAEGYAPEDDFQRVYSAIWWQTAAIVPCGVKFGFGEANGVIGANNLNGHQNELNNKKPETLKRYIKLTKKYIKRAIAVLKENGISEVFAKAKNKLSALRRGAK